MIILFSASSFAQETNCENSFVIVEDVPIYPGCHMKKNKTERKNCMSTKISKLISRKFNVKLADNLGLPNGLVKIVLHFKINKKGEIIDADADAPHRKLREEAIRVIKLIPKMKRPGMHRGQAVTVPFAIPVNFYIDS
ncbi:TonB protein C-terminal [Winogradskyella jejuensis]|uniref:TonB protein C-terminal n=2 Tax=Winogradskyella jejuensis TaxID=1089305 RepID=A0A1M5LLT0_9FLAO|nr:TonB protein C-terminal [Winogradskyella jejuensis]